MMNEKRVKFNIRGHSFIVLQSTLENFPNTKLSDLSQLSDNYDPLEKEYYFDRDPEAFNVMINAISSGELHMPMHICSAIIRQEMEFWKIPLDIVSECCWKIFCQFEEENEIRNNLKQEVERYEAQHRRNSCTEHYSSHAIWKVLENPRYSNLAMAWHYFYLFVVALSTLVYCLATIPELRAHSYLSDLSEHNISAITNKKLKDLLFEDPVPVLFALEIFCLLIFTTELILHLIFCPNRVKFLSQPLSIVNIVLIIVMLMTLVLEIEKDLIIENSAATVFYLVIKSCNMIRILQIFRLEKQFKAFRVLLLAIRASLRELVLMVLSFFMVVLVFSSLMYYCEIMSNESLFYDIFVTMWWATVTMTTVGYGDFHPTTPFGYLVGSLCTVCGILIIALPIAVIASNFANHYSCYICRKWFMHTYSKRKNERFKNKISPQEKTKVSSVSDIQP